MPGVIRIILEAASFFGNNLGIVAALSASLLIYLVVAGFLKEAGVFILSTLSFFYSVFLKNIFKLPRPDSYAGDPTKLGDIYSFPSSHVIFYVCFWGFLLFLSLKKDIFDGNFTVFVIRAVSIYHIVFVGVSRVLLGAHTLQDVVAGYFFGLLYLAVLIYLVK